MGFIVPRLTDIYFTYSNSSTLFRIHSLVILVRYLTFTYLHFITCYHHALSIMS